VLPAAEKDAWRDMIFDRSPVFCGQEGVIPRFRTFYSHTDQKERGGDSLLTEKQMVLGLHAGNELRSMR
jgi:hypothetical protein